MPCSSSALTTSQTTGKERDGLKIGQIMNTSICSASAGVALVVALEVKDLVNLSPVSKPCEFASVFLET